MNKPATKPATKPAKPRFSIELPELQNLNDLEAQVSAAGGEPLRLDPKTIQPSRWANRHETSFEDDDFKALKEEIQDAEGNVQPIMIRPLKEPVGEVRYEVVFGHRRHRACLETGVEVLAVVQDLDDQKLWAFMERENRQRKNLSAWEQGMMYVRALEAGLFPSMLALARAIGRSQGDVSAAISIANLPTEVVEAFVSPQDIRFRDAKELKDAVAKAPEAVIAVAQDLAKDEERTAADVREALVQAANDVQESADTAGSKARKGSKLGAQADTLNSMQLAAGGKGQGAQTGELRVKIAGKPVVFRANGKNTLLEIDARLLPQERWAAFEGAIRKLLKP